MNNDSIVTSANLFWVVGIGASAGGLDAFKQLIKAIPVNSGMAYILVQHLDPKHESILTELLQKITLIPIHEIIDNVHVEPNNIYVIPPNKLLTASDGILQLRPRQSNTQKNMSIDIFFSSLAQVHQSQAIGVVLSGTGKDGTLGLTEIKRHGGLTFAQHKESAAYDEMPQSAINEGVVDFVLSPKEIVAHLLNLPKPIKEDSLVIKPNFTPLPEDVFYKQILALLDLRKAVDFTYYKQSSLHRRIARRMISTQHKRIKEYADYLAATPTEVDLLFNDILIPVTEFFRDPLVFEQLCETALPQLSKNKKEGESFRVWSVGCSTGQEAYSIAICLCEHFEHHANKIKIQIFATDISDGAISKARAGFYSANEVTNISAARLEKFFTKTEGGFQINKVIRDVCVFAYHNILIDPPFADIDLISCRNMLIYMDTFLQRKIMTTFHYSLKENGMLLLGKSEAPGHSADLFLAVSESNKLYARKSVPGRFTHIATRRKKEFLSGGLKLYAKDIKPNDDFQRNADDVILANADAGVIVNDLLEIVQFRGATGEWLESASGKPSLHILKMARHGLVLELRSALHKARLTKEPITKNDIPLYTKGMKKLVTIDVIPLLNTINPYYLVSFINTKEIPDVLLPKKPGKGKLKINLFEVRTNELEKELAQTREDMRTITEDQEAGNEEMLSANEELVSGSEELRSLNEELEISKEELQSTVEELSASNQELETRNEQLNHSRKYAEAIVTTIREPLVVLDKDLRVKTANASFYKTFHGIENKTEGKLFYEIQNNQWDIPALRNLLERTVIEETFYDSYEIKQKFSFIGERTIILNVRRMVSNDAQEQLLLLAFEDLTDKRTIDAKLKQSSEYVKAILESSPQIASTASADGKETYFNQFYLDYSGLTFDEAVALGWEAVIHPGMLEEEKQAWVRAVKTGEDFHKELLLRRHDGIYRWHNSRSIPVRNEEGIITSWVGATSDIHDQKMFSDELEKKILERTQLLKELNVDLEYSNKNLEQFAFIASHDLQEPLRKIKTFTAMLSRDYYEQLPEEGQNLISRIHKSSDRMSSLIQDVLNFSQIENSKSVFIKVDTNEILTKALEDFNLLIIEKNVIINRGDLPSFEGERYQITQLFYNLISNALKFIRPDIQPVITISAHILTEAEVTKNLSLNPEQSYCEILFEDNGIGIEAEFKEKIFEIFQRLHSKDKFQGTGIGLALCKKIIINHHGEIFVTSEENIGSVFHVILPMTQA